MGPNKITYTILVVLVLTLAGFLSWFYASNETNTPNPAELKPPSNQDILRSGNVEEYMVVAEELTETISNDLEFLLPSAEAYTIKNVIYSNGEKGYRIESDSELPLLSAYTVYVRHFSNNNWAREYGGRVENFAVLSASKSPYKAVATFSGPGDRQTRIVIDIINENL